MARISPTGRNHQVSIPQGDKKGKKSPLTNLTKKVANTAYIQPPMPSFQSKPPSEAKGLIKRTYKAFSRMQPKLAKL